MSKSTSLRTVTLIPSPNIRVSSPITKSKTILPALKFINSAGAPAIVQLKDGDFRQVFQIKGINLIDAQQFGDKLEELFKELLDATDCHIQVLLTSRPFAIGSRQQLLDQPASPNPYLAWYSDYLFKWFNKVSEVSCLPKLSFYLVITVPGKLISAKSKPAIFKAIAKHTDATQKALIAMGQDPRLLDRSELRTLIAQSFVSPPLDSQQDIVDETPECIAPATIDEPAFEVKRDSLRLGNLMHHTCTISQLPTRIWWGWLLDLICQAKAFTLSLHLRSCNQAQVKKQIKQAQLSSQKLKSLQSILNSQSKAIDLSCYLSTYSDASTTAASNLATYKRILNQRKAIATNCLGKQDLAWRACLPLGLDEVKQTSRISSEVAAASWPAVRVVPDQALGLPLGFGLASREPYFLDLYSNQNCLLTGSEQVDVTATAVILAMRFLSINKQVLYLGTSDAAKQLTEVLGPDLCSKLLLTDDYSGPSQADKTTTTGEHNHSLFYFDCTALKSTKDSKVIIEQLKTFARVKGRRIFIEDSSLFLSNGELKTAFAELLGLARDRDCQIFAGLEAKMLKTAPELWSPFKNQIVLSPQSTDRETVYKHLQLSENIYFDEDPSVCLSVSGAERCMLWLVWSPMEVGIVLRGQNANQRNDLAQLRNSIHVQILKNNPKLSKTDAWRQTIYQFGLQA